MKWMDDTNSNPHKGTRPVFSGTHSEKAPCGATPAVRAVVDPPQLVALFIDDNMLQSICVNTNKYADVFMTKHATSSGYPSLFLNRKCSLHCACICALHAILTDMGTSMPPVVPRKTGRRCPGTALTVSFASCMCLTTPLSLHLRLMGSRTLHGAR